MFLYVCRYVCTFAKENYQIVCACLKRWVLRNFSNCSRLAHCLMSVSELFHSVGPANLAFTTHACSSLAHMKHSVRCNCMVHNDSEKIRRGVVEYHRMRQGAELVNNVLFDRKPVKTVQGLLSRNQRPGSSPQILSCGSRDRCTICLRVVRGDQLLSEFLRLNIKELMEAPEIEETCKMLVWLHEATSQIMSYHQVVATNRVWCRYVNPVETKQGVSLLKLIQVMCVCALFSLEMKMSCRAPVINGHDSFFNVHLSSSASDVVATVWKYICIMWCLKSRLRMMSPISSVGRQMINWDGPTTFPLHAHATSWRIVQSWQWTTLGTSTSVFRYNFINCRY
jgi:hypothetical protein